MGAAGLVCERVLETRHDAGTFGLLVVGGGRVAALGLVADAVVLLVGEALAAEGRVDLEKAVVEVHLHEGAGRAVHSLEFLEEGRVEKVGLLVEVEHVGRAAEVRGFALAPAGDGEADLFGLLGVAAHNAVGVGEGEGGIRLRGVDGDRVDAVGRVVGLLRQYFGR